MTRAILAIIIWSVTASVAAAQSKTETVAHVLTVGVGVTAFGDVFATGVVFGRFPNAKELNPALAWSQRSAVGIGIVKGAIAAGQVEGLAWLHTRKPRTAIVIAIGTIALNGWAMHHNAKLLRTH